MTLFLPYNRQVWSVEGMVSAKTSPLRKISSQMRTCWSIVPMEQVFLDTLYIGCEKFPQHDYYGGFVGGVR